MKVRWGKQCPSGDDHGPLLMMRDGRWYCPHEAHNAGVNLKGGKASRCFWTMEEVERDRT